MGTDRFILGSPEVLAVRFAIAPGAEGVRAIRRMSARHRAPMQRSIIERLRRDTPAAALATLTPLAGFRGYTPDFLTQPEVTNPRDLLAATRNTPLDLVHAELRCAAADGRPLPSSWLEDPEFARTTISDAWESFWNVGMSASWPRIRRVLEADVAVRARHLARDGLKAVVEDLDPRFRWQGKVLLRTESRFSVETDCRGRGLRLCPTVLGWPRGAITTDEPWPPTIYYPARNAALADPTRDLACATIGLIGSTRAAILDHLRVPARTSDVAIALSISPATASYHLGILRDTGLVTTQRRGKEAWHARASVTDSLGW